jgi:glycosyltransferase involved in cell wall biosynthesis
VPDSIVIIPTYNEKENIERMIRKVFTLPHDFHVLIIDDGSPDGTANIVKQLQQEYPGKLFLEERSGKQGLGTAYIRISMALSGQLSIITILFLRWMPIFHTIPMTCLD